MMQRANDGVHVGSITLREMKKRLGEANPEFWIRLWAPREKAEQRNQAAAGW